MCVPGLFRLAQISLTKAFHRSSAETRIGKTKTTTTTILTLSQNVVLSNFNQIPSFSMHFVFTLALHLFLTSGIIELIATYSYTTIQTCEYPLLPESFLRKDNHCHARCSRCLRLWTSFKWFQATWARFRYMYAKVYEAHLKIVWLDQEWKKKKRTGLPEYKLNILYIDDFIPLHLQRHQVPKNNAHKPGKYNILYMSASYLGISLLTICSFHNGLLPLPCGIYPTQHGPDATPSFWPMIPSWVRPFPGIWLSDTYNSICRNFYKNLLTHL